MFGGLLGGKRGPETQPLQHPTASGHLQDVAPPAKMVAPEQSVREVVEALSATVATLSGQLGTALEEVAGLGAKVSKLTLQLQEQKAVATDLNRENQSLKSAMARADENTVALGKKVQGVEEALRKRRDSPPSAGVNAEINQRQEQTVQQLTQLEQQVEHQERQTRQSNVMVFSLAEDPGRTPVQQVKAALQAAGVPGGDRIVHAVRLGVPPPPPPPPGFQIPTAHRAPRPRPVKVMLQSTPAASDLLRHTRRLRERLGVFLDKDLTPKQVHIRKQLEGPAKELRSRGVGTLWKGERLWCRNRQTGRDEPYNASVHSRT